MKRFFLPTVLIASFGLTSGAWAGSLYGSVGVPGLLGGYAEPVSATVTLRADVASTGSHSRTRNDDGIRYVGRVKAQRIGLFADAFIHGGFRFTGGLTLNEVRLDLTGHGNGGTLRIGDTTYATGPDDRFDVDVKFPRATPYLGIGYGHAGMRDKGWRWLFDLGLSVGKARVSGKASGPLLSSTVAQADVERELDDIRGDVRRVKGIPQLSVGMSYRF